MPQSDELRVAVSAVRAASRVCVKVQRALVTAETLEKRDKSPVTVADYASQAVVCAVLGEAFAELPVVGEEAAAELREDANAALRASVAQHAGLSEGDALSAIDRGGFDPAQDRNVKRYWALDPIDGTKGFLRGEQYAVALALIEEGQVTLGVLGCPNLDGGRLMVAQHGQGTRVLPVEGDALDGEVCRVTDTTESADACFCESVESGHSDHDASSRIAADLGITKPPYRIDSQCKYAALALGRADVYLRLPTKPGYREKVWDHAAGALVVQEAGGAVTDVRGNALHFGAGRTLQPDAGVVASNGKFHGQVIGVVDTVLG